MKFAIELAGRTALVTGATSGIGNAIALAFAEHGAKVLMHGKTESDAHDAVNAMPATLLGRATAIAADLSIQGEALSFASRAQSMAGSVDIVVLSAAIQSRRAFSDVDEAQLREEIQVNFLSSYQILQRLVPSMAMRNWGRVLAIGSVQQVRPNPALSVYAATKSAQLNLVINLAKTYARSGVTVNNLAPGLIDTHRNADIKLDTATYAQILERIPMGRAGNAQDCAGAALFLCSDLGQYITGIDLLVDGGLHLP